MDTSAAISALFAAKHSASQELGLKSILIRQEHGENAVPGRVLDKLSSLKSYSCTYDFPPCEKHDRKVYIRFSESVMTKEFTVTDDSNSWKKVRSLSSSRIKSFDSSSGSGYTGDVLGHSSNRPTNRKSPSKQSAVRLAVARALSLASLLGLPARTSCDQGLGCFIADTGCGKDMVGGNSLTDDLVKKNSWKK